MGNLIIEANNVVPHAKLKEMLLLRARAQGKPYGLLIRDIMGGRKSPTIVPLADSTLVAVHAVVAEDEFWEKMEALKSFGASDILVMNIEKMMV
jgi:ATP phosphoribosyltransferase